MKFAHLYEVRLVHRFSDTEAVWSVRGNGIDRKVTIGGTMPSVVALNRALEEQSEDDVYIESMRQKRMLGGGS